MTAVERAAPGAIVERAALGAIVERPALGAIVERAALGAVGTRFRLHGREAASGLDCIGLVALALRAGGCVVEVPTGYALRGGDPARVASWLDAVLVRSDGLAAGDVVVMRSGPGQLHFAVRSARGIVHADAALRRVVERPGTEWPELGPVLGSWRIGPRVEPRIGEA